MQCTRAAFSLIELAIVIAIIGILLGGVVATNSFLTAAKQKTLINEGKLFINAFKQFEKQYGGAKPGDMGNATSFWTASAACPTTGAEGTACNGDGNNIVGYQSSAAPETFYAFRHLKLAGLISGDYTGNSTGAVGTLYATSGVNIPAMTMEGAGGYFYGVSATGSVTSDAAYYDGNYGTPFFIGANATNYLPQNNLIDANTMKKLDQKFDDGTPGGGWIRPFMNYTNCSSAGAYLIANKEIGCTIILLNP